MTTADLRGVHQQARHLRAQLAALHDAHPGGECTHDPEYDCTPAVFAAQVEQWRSRSAQSRPGPPPSVPGPAHLHSRDDRSNQSACQDFNLSNTATFQDRRATKYTATQQVS
ncbi:hypothetical protein ACFROC_36835 [Nocardia tengchongensis]|uniref:hypothetical protein n=1 Tax=Nocardia tengchongensis TaxID=2055889 RepID=UPI0036C11FCA